MLVRYATEVEEVNSKRGRNIKSSGGCNSIITLKSGGGGHDPLPPSYAYGINYIGYIPRARLLSESGKGELSSH